MPKEPNYRQIEKKILDDVLSPDVYDPRIRPAGLNTTGEQNKFVKNKKYLAYFQTDPLSCTSMFLLEVSRVSMMLKW